MGTRLYFVFDMCRILLQTNSRDITQSARRQDSICVYVSFVNVIMSGCDTFFNSVGLLTSLTSGLQCRAGFTSNSIA